MSKTLEWRPRWNAPAEKAKQFVSDAEGAIEGMIETLQQVLGELKRTDTRDFLYPWGTEALPLIEMQTTLKDAANALCAAAEVSTQLLQDDDEYSDFVMNSE